ncbi:MAG: hypothetical protein H6667_06125 [Ardenticatenaceae bacterium]|nr:hypothetical protein [Ardenticatenaceae bacterium]MCB9443768.1 hypothetical protein [Ardenticatenaceae bacterium]
MSDKKKPQQDLDQAMLALREEYEQTIAPLEERPEPKQGKELKGRRFPKVVSYLMGVVAVMMLIVAIFLFNMQSGPSGNRSDTNMAGVTVETAVNSEHSLPIANPPLLIAPPPPQELIPPPPAPTPWPTPPIAPDSQG